MKRLSEHRYFTMFSLILAASSIYLIPYMRQSYHVPLLNALQITNTQLGILNSVYGISAMLCYIPGGLLADKISPRKLLTISLVTTGLAGLVFSTFPTYSMLVALHIFWGISTILPFWAAIIKATRNWGTETEQGKAFGIFDGGRGIIEGVVISIGVAVFAYFGAGNAGLRSVIIIYSSCSLVTALLIWFLVSEENSNDNETTHEPIAIKEIIEVLKMPVVWLISLVVFTAFGAFLGSFDITPFATDGFQQSEVFGATLSSFRMWFRPVAAIGAGILADRFSSTKTIIILFILLALSYALFAVMPTTSTWLMILWINTGVLAIVLFSLRGIYYALLEESKIPFALTGTVTGIISLFGYLPDIFLPIVNGLLLDRYPGAAGHQYYYWILAFLACIGCVAAWGIRYIIKKDSINSAHDIPVIK